ncbi:MAG: hypothetical protein HY725_08910 [Candidatus Rokubacteria bacterium]|nr:hypothetical protein [Candidatus Rokubacteria bacterium]
MNWREMIRLTGLLVIALLMLLSASAVAETTNHSGTILALNKEAGTIVLGEMGPWRVKGGVTLITERTIAVTSATVFKQVKRAPGAGPTGWVGEFVETGLGAWELKKGDFVTVQVRQEGQRLTALSVAVVAPGAP